MGVSGLYFITRCSQQNLMQGKKVEQHLLVRSQGRPERPGLDAPALAMKMSSQPFEVLAGSISTSTNPQIPRSPAESFRVDDLGGRHIQGVHLGDAVL